MIRFENVSKQYNDGAAAVRDLNLTINKGEFFVLIGPSGSGKTTTLKMINRLISLSGGTLFINEKKVSEYTVHELRWNIGYVLQQISLFPHMSVEENIAVVPEMKKWTKEKIATKTNDLLKMVGLDPAIYKHRKPSELSGGQQQRIGVLRALAADPEIILMDEPFSALDPISRENLQEDIVKLQKTIKKTIVFVTHDIQEAFKLGDRICIMKDGEIVQVGTRNELINHPANDFVREFIGKAIDAEKPFYLENILAPFNGSQLKEEFPVIPHTSSLAQTLKALSDKDAVGVEKDGEMIGLVNRQTLIQHLSIRLKEGDKND